MSGQNVETVYKKELCCSCGICSGLCPEKAITYRYDKYGYLKPHVDDKTCTQCGRCVKYCPGNAFKIMQGTTFSSEDVYFCGNTKNDNLRYEAASGGVITELLIYLTNAGIVDECIVVPSVTDVEQVSPLMTHDETEIRSARGSKYCPVAFGEVLQVMCKSKKKYAVVALPCQIQVLNELFKGRRKDFIFISLFCNHCSSANASKFLLHSTDIKEYSLMEYRGRGWPGSFMIQAPEKTEVYEFRPLYLKSFGKYFYNTRCRFCNDPFGYFADISAADAFMNSKDENGSGKTFVCVRNVEMLKIIQDMKRKDLLYLEEIKEIEKIRRAYPSQVNRQTTTVKNMKMLRKIRGKKFKAPLGSENMERTSAVDPTWMESFKFFIKLRIYGLISASPGLWKMIFILHRHKKDKRIIK